MLLAATAGLVLYRLVGRFHGRRAGLAAGLLLGVATPVGFWATLPKRHTVVATLVLGAVYAFAVSRTREGDAALRARAGAYALAGYITWIHAYEALFVVAVLGAVDLATARDRSVRALAVLGLVLLVASTPMLATNYAISGNPAQPPRVLPGVDTEVSPATDGPTAGPDATPTPGSGGGSDPPPSPLDVVRTLVGTVSTFAGRNLAGGLAVLTQPERLWHIFVRSGTIPGVSSGANDYEPVDLAALEAMPLLAGLAALPVLAARRVRARVDETLLPLDPRDWSPTRQTDLLVVSLAAILTVVYLPRLPIHSSLTVRYLHPVMALGVYGVWRVPAVRAAVSDTRWAVGSYLASVAVALVVLLAGIGGLGLAVGEAVQYNALWNLAAAVVCGAVVVAYTVSNRVPDRTVAVAVALPAGFASAYLLLSGLVYFRYGSYAFDVVRVLADVLPAL